MTDILLIGCGNMGNAMLSQWLNEESYKFTVLTPSKKDLPAKVTIYTQASELGSQRFNIIIIAIKPQLIAQVLPEYQDKLAPQGIVVSIAAGTSLDSLASYFKDAAIVRIMPNLPALIGKSMNGMVANQITTHTQQSTAETLINFTGESLWLETEDQLDRLTAITGSGPGYIFYIIESYIQAAQTLGFNYADAKKMVLHTMIGSAELAQESELTPLALRTSVTSKNGVTQAGLIKLMQDDELKKRLADTVKAAYDRAVDLRTA